METISNTWGAKRCPWSCDLMIQIIMNTQKRNTYMMIINEFLDLTIIFLKFESLRHVLCYDAHKLQNCRIVVPIPETDTKHAENDQKHGDTWVSNYGNIFVINLETWGHIWPKKPNQLNLIYCSFRLKKLDTAQLFFVDDRGTWERRSGGSEEQRKSETRRGT